jgi:hypothetical protein
MLKVALTHMCNFCGKLFRTEGYSNNLLIKKERKKEAKELRIKER